MAELDGSTLNSFPADEERTLAGKVGWIRALALVPARTVLLLTAQAVFAATYRWRNAPDPWRSSAAWWTVYGSLADFGCLLLLVVLTRRERLRVRDLFQTNRKQGRLQVLRQGVVYFLVVMPTFLGGFSLSSYVVYGSFRPGVDAALLGARRLPIWAALYSVTLWWIIWSATEELTYQAYFLQRFRTLSGRVIPAMAIVGFWWSVQHSALPFIPDFKYVIWRFLSFVPGVTVLMTIYLRTRRLAPIIVAHWLMDLIASASTIDWH